MKIKKLIICVMLLILAMSFSSCRKKDERVLGAIDEIKEHWDELYDDDYEDKYLEITNTTIVNIKDDIDFEKLHESARQFEDVDYIVEFDLHTNFFDSAPYYTNMGMDNCVVCKKDGALEVSRMSPLKAFRSRAFENDFSGIIESVEQLHGEYDCIIELDKN